MLVLTRRISETIKIGNDIEVTVMAVNGGQVRIGIKAPLQRRGRPRGDFRAPATEPGAAAGAVETRD